jgi:hypothetical protein
MRSTIRAAVGAVAAWAEGAAAAAQWSDTHSSKITNVVSAPETVFVTAAWYTSAGLGRCGCAQRARPKALSAVGAALEYRRGRSHAALD